MLEGAIFAVGLVMCALGLGSANSLFSDHVTKPFSASDMHWVDNQGQFMQSASGNFILTFFYSSRNQYYLSVVLGAAINQIVWTANRNVPVSQADNLIFQDDGNVILFGPRGLPVWSTGTNGTDAQTLRLLDSGNLVVQDSRNRTLWESFAHPTDVIVVGQKLQRGMKLTSKRSTTDFSQGPYSLSLGDHTLELEMDMGGGALVPYWRLATDVRSILNFQTDPEFASVSPGQLGLYDGSSTLVATLPLPSQTNSSGTMVLLVLGSDGNLKSRAFTSSGQLPDASVFLDNCLLPSPCGPYGVCSSNGQCNCPASLPLINPSSPTQGCKVAALDLCKSPQDFQFQDLDTNLFYFANQFATPASAVTLQDCKRLCTENCSCTTGFFNTTSGSCYLSNTVKLGSFDSTNGGFQTFIKAPKKQGNDGQKSILIYVIVGCSLGLILALIGGFVWWYKRRLRAARADPDEEDGFLEAIPGLPARFTYKELQTATNGFSKKLGGGGFGSVYEGTLPDKSKVAVKQLESIGQGKKEFRAEVATIGSIHHVNLVRLRGFCSEGTHRLLVYEFLARGSLDKSLFNESSSQLLSDSPVNQQPPVVLDWDTRYNIALGTARGLVYLHEDCRERIIHCDIKPENILLDEHFTAKVSDFGLAKLMNREQSHVFTTMRGTRGYLAPEWLLNTAISEKSDVYSFGMVLLEIVSGRKNFDPNETSDKWYIPAYAFKQAEVGALVELLDARLKGHSNEEQVVKAVKIALWCIQEEMHLRPSIGKVVQMLEGNVPVPDPPLSSQLAVRLHARMADAVSERDGYSLGSEFNSEDLLSASYLSGPR
ncbi:G-type lectin S-receptor-like serine/threonine-protein kinase SD2-5 [Selaginella moellendorffii]|nr:G-type lectin S-receptor-like serine/threonine-protein kinase SD2-5 [Selaginella moellendorffii]XP_024524843.1 G-type lectin S-receptor-like serine/threonine-protein kinase SD2-5 [Selaginella moellendorffii]|eukprot:XP_002964086.2 G-type lectin S-receptor-like serine/threonine-protein kinase SD2-5 [Selaginella moellendorffii]